MSKIAEVYKFTYLSQSEYYTSYDQAFNYQDQAVEPHNLKRGRIQQSQDVAKADLTFTAELDFNVATVYQAGGTVQRIQVDVIRVDPDQAHADPQYVGSTMFSGFIANVDWAGTHLKIKCDHVIAMLNSSTLRYQYSRGCNHSQYGTKCKVPFAGRAESTTITAVKDNGYTLDITPLDGAVFINSSGALCKVNGEQGTISQQLSSSTIRLFRPIPNAAAGDTIEIAPPCFQDWVICRDFFNNLHNCTAFVDVPEQNPFGVDGLKG